MAIEEETFVFICEVYTLASTAMSSEVYFRFKANIKQDTIQFDGSAISVKDLKSAIKTKCCLRTGDFDLKLEDSTGKEYTKESELIPKYTNVIVKRVPKASGDSQRKKPQQNNAVRDKNVSISTVLCNFVLLFP